MANDLDSLGPLGAGSHGEGDVACVMEAVAFVAGEPWSDQPCCACPVIGTFLRAWNDALPDADRDRFLRPMVPLLIGTRGTRTLERRRMFLAADWLVRIQTPEWLLLTRLPGIDTHANLIRQIPEIVGGVGWPRTIAALKAGWMAMRPRHTGPWISVGEDARVTGWEAARETAWDICPPDLWHAPTQIAAEASFLARALSRAPTVNLTVERLQRSAIELLGRMIAEGARGAYGG